MWNFEKYTRHILISKVYFWLNFSSLTFSRWSKDVLERRIKIYDWNQINLWLVWLPEIENMIFSTRAHFKGSADSLVQIFLWNSDVQHFENLLYIHVWTNGNKILVYWESIRANTRALKNEKFCLLRRFLKMFYNWNPEFSGKWKMSTTAKVFYFRNSRISEKGNFPFD